MGQEQLEFTRRLRAIRRLAHSFPMRSAQERLDTIAQLATGQLAPGAVRKRPDGAEMVRRLRKAQGQKVAEPEEPEKSRKAKRGRDRMDRGGLDREPVPAVE